MPFSRIIRLLPFGRAAPPLDRGAPDRFLQGARMGRRADKEDLILDACRDKDVLDLGCVEHSWTMSLNNPRWLHSRIREVAASCIGVDFLAADVAELNQRGFHMVHGDVLVDKPPGQFDVVVAGDLIEHLDNLGIFLDYVASALRLDGRAVITTPNAYYLDQLWTVLLRGAPDISPEHAVLFDPFTFEKLVARSRLRVREFYWLRPSWWVLCTSKHFVVKALGKAMHLACRWILAVRPYLNSDFAAVVELKRAGDEPFNPEQSAQAVLDFLHKPSAAA